MADAPSDLAARAAAIVATLDLESAVRLLSGHDFWTTEPLPDHGIPAVTMTDGPHGLRKQDPGVEHLGIESSHPATCFPTASLLASTWDPALVERVGAALGSEARSLGVDVVLGPGLNLKRHPAAGRNFEYFSEDPLLAGELAGALARGIQSRGVGACLKHYVANNQESHRFRIDTVVDERTLRELYLRGFEIAIERSRPWTMMSSYNLVDGEHVGESRRLVADVLRGELGFDGMLMSDWTATSDRVAGIRAGLDLEMPGSGGTWDGDVIAAVRSGELERADIDAAATRVVTLALRAQAARAAVPAAQADLEAHHALARHVAAAGTVLATNDGILPLASTERLAVIGDFARAPRYQGAGSSLVNPVRLTTVLGALADRGIDTAFAPGYHAASGETTDALIAEAVATARAAHTVLLMVGLPEIAETEGLDRPHLDLPAGQGRLIDAVLTANPRTIVALSLGAPVVTPWADRAAAVLIGYLGGQAAAEALVDVVLGDAEPRGRLAESWPMATEDLPATAHFADHPTQVQYREGLAVGYRFHSTWGVPARFAFGHGLGYTHCELSSATVSGGPRELAVSVDVTNAGARRGTSVVQVYVHRSPSVAFRPELSLAGFATVELPPGRAERVTIHLERRTLEVYDAAARRWALEAGDYELRVGFSSVDIRATARFTVEGSAADAPTPTEPWAGPVATEREFRAAYGRAVPEPARLRPFTRETLVADLRLTRAGRIVRRLLTRQMHKAFGVGDGGVNLATATAYAEGTPLRAIAMYGPRFLTMRRLDAAIRLLNVMSGRSV